MSLWDELPAGAQNSGALDQVRPLLQGLGATDDGLQTDTDGTWHVYTATGTWPTPISLDPGSGGFGNGGTTSTTPIEFPDPTVSVELALHQTAAADDGGWRVTLAVPIVLVRLPFLRGAELDGQGQLRANGMPVTFTLPALRIRAKQLSGQSVGVELLSAETGGTPVDHIYEFISMNPPYALVGPSDVVGFAFRTAVLDLSGTAGPNVPAVPAEARAMPADWQGFYLPEARLFVAPTGLQGIAVSAGVRNLWIGLGVHAGVTGIFEAEVVNRGGTPALSVSFRTASGEWVGDPGTGAAELPEHATLFVDTAGGLAPITISISVDGTVTADDRVELTVPSSGNLSITVTATDGAGNPTTRTFTVVRRSAPGATGAGSSTVTVTPTNSRPHGIRRVSETATHVKLTTDPPVAANWTWAGGGAGPSIEADVPVAAGARVDVTATLPATQPQVIDAYYLFAQPDVFNPNTTATEPLDPTFPDALKVWATNPSNVHVGVASTRTNPGSSTSLWDSLTPAVITQIGAGTALTVKGYASWEGPDHDTTNDADYNRRLSERRRDVMIHLLHRKGFTNVTAGSADGFTLAKSQTTSVEGTTPPPAAGSGAWWRARATTAGNGEETITARVERVVRPPAREVDRTPPTGGRPDCFRKIGVRVELLRSTFIRAEVYGEFDIETAAETALRQHSQPALRSGPRNPSDGICTFLVRLRIAEDRDSWLVSAEFRAAEADLDGLAQMDVGHSDPTALNVLGALSILAPLSSAAAELSPAAGALVSIGSIALGASSLINTQKIILRGGELVVSQGTIAADGSATVDPRGTTISILLDVEVTFTFDLTIVRVNPDHPVTTRYKAIGVRSSWNTAPDPAHPGHVDYLPIPVFDPSKGYTLDIPAGALSASPPLDELLRVLGFRVSRDNPTYMEVEVGLGLDLGIVTVETVRIRARLDGPFELTLTKLAASLEVPGVLHGKGSLEFTPFGFKGYFDLTVTPINLRASAVLAVETKNGVTGVLIGAEVELPVPLLLGNSGLGIYGFLGGVGINYARDESPYASRPVPALDWLQAQLERGHVMHPDGWTHTAGSYAFAAGMLLGTVDGGFVVNLKGIILIEVPGPRLLLVMKADVLKLPPVLKDASQSATFLAVLDIDFGRGTITLGIVAAYEIKSLLKIRVPVTAFFDTNHPQNWLVDLGSYEDRVTIEVLDVISGSGYLMVHGNGISGIADLPPVTGGMAIATGFHISCVLMGSKAVGLYLEVAAGFDAILGFDPFFLAGKIYVRGELRLFIVSIGASAELDVLVGRTTQTSPDITYVHGEVCGEVDFFFFSVKGCVSLTIGTQPSETLNPPPLVAGVSLVSRSPALVEGTGAERAIDGKLADALKTGATGTAPSVPLDAIPVVLFNTAPAVGGQVMGGTPLGNSGSRPWVRLGDRWWAYEITAVTLTGDLQPAPPAGKTPSSWWKQTSPADPASGPALALLNWLPTPFSRALPYGEALSTSVTDRWGTVCNPAAPPAPVLWTFDHKPPGPSTVGWNLDGIPWPDPPDTVRTRPVHGECDVTEAWRSGDPAIDILQGTTPAVVVGDSVPCCKRGPARPNANPLKQWLALAGTTFSNRTADTEGKAWGEVAQALANGTSLGDVQATRLAMGWDPGLGRATSAARAAAAAAGPGVAGVPGVAVGAVNAAAVGGLGCEGRILRSPVRDSDQPAPMGTEEDMDRVKRAWARLKFTPSDLRDTVRIRPDGGAGDLTILMLVPEEIFVQRLVIRWLDDKGQVLDQRGLDSDDRVDTDNPLPAAWVDGDGPWADPVCRAGQVAARVAARADWPQTLVLVHSRDFEGVATVEIGWDSERFTKDQQPPSFHVVAMTGVLTSEASRWSWDTSVVTSEQEAISTALTQDPDDHALLVPGRPYTVTVDWRAASIKQDAEPTAAPTWDGGHTDSYGFTADGADKSPQDLAPWLLASAPGMDDVGVLCAEPIRIALATQNVAALFDAYGKELRVIVLSASGKHPAPPGGGAPGTGFTVPMVADGVFLKKLKGLAVSTPWEEAVLEVLGEGQRCIDISGERVRHDVLELPYDLEPLTDYLIDVHAVPKGSPAGERALVHRIGFTTSGFGTVGQLADLLRAARWRHTVVSAIGPLSALPDAPTGDQLDTAFQAAGLAAPQTPGAPSVQVLWSTDATPTPLAVVVECSETLWRSRLMPTQVQGPIDSVDPTHHWWAARPTDWLSLKPSTAPAPAGALPVAGVTRIVRGPGLARAVVLLDPGARGKRLVLDLVVAADALANVPESRAVAVDVPLQRAPWEEEL